MDREELLELILGAIAEYKDVDVGDLDSGDSFTELELDPVDVMNIVQDIAEGQELEVPRGYEFTQSPEELADYICG